MTIALLSLIDVGQETFFCLFEMFTFDQVLGSEFDQSTTNISTKIRP